MQNSLTAKHSFSLCETTSSLTQRETVFVYNNDFVSTAHTMQLIELIVLWPDTIPWATLCTWFSIHIVVLCNAKSTYATHEENSIYAHNSNHTCPLKWFVFVAC